MTKKARECPRSSNFEGQTTRSRALVPKPADARQPDLFEVPFTPPCKPKLATKVPVGDLWQYEIKHDGYRAQCHMLGGRVKVYTKSGMKVSSCLSGIVRDLQALPIRSAVIDGEAVMLDGNGVSDFFALHAAMSNFRAPDAVLFAFDLLNLDGEDLRARPLAERRAMLAELLVGTPAGLHLSEHHVGDGPKLLKAACAMGLEGIVAKRRDAAYRSGDSTTWLKVKCTEQDHFAVIGFDPAGSRGVASLKLARLVGRELVPCGSAGSGIGEKASREMRAALDRGAHVVAAVEFRGQTPAGELRHPVFKGWHGDERQNKERRPMPQAGSRGSARMWLDVPFQRSVGQVGAIEVDAVEFDGSNNL